MLLSPEGTAVARREHARYVRGYPIRPPARRSVLASPLLHGRADEASVCKGVSYAAPRPARPPTASAEAPPARVRAGAGYIRGYYMRPPARPPRVRRPAFSRAEAWIYKGVLYPAPGPACTAPPARVRADA